MAPQIPIPNIIKDTATSQPVRLCSTIVTHTQSSLYIKYESNIQIRFPFSTPFPSPKLAPKYFIECFVLFKNTFTPYLI